MARAFVFRRFPAMPHPTIPGHPKRPANRVLTNPRRQPSQLIAITVPMLSFYPILTFVYSRLPSRLSSVCRLFVVVSLHFLAFYYFYHLPPLPHSPGCYSPPPFPPPFKKKSGSLREGSTLAGIGYWVGGRLTGITSGGNRTGKGGVWLKMIIVIKRKEMATKRRQNERKRTTNWHTKLINGRQKTRASEGAMVYSVVIAGRYSLITFGKLP